jgi:hypothetical protein
MSTILCPSCGAPVAATARFCGHCGMPTSGALGRPPAPPLPTPASSALTPGTLLDNGRYRLVRAVKSGGMGAVYLAQDGRLADQECAIKELIVPAQQTQQERADSEAWFTREARLLANLRHPLIPRISNHFSEGGRRYLVMDFIEGQNLEGALAAHGGPFAPAVVLEWARALGDVLTYLHGQQPPIIFRDLNPANIMRAAQGTLMLVDFGIARTLRGPGGTGTRGTGTVIGTPGYAPPEQYQGLVEPRSDQYALAATLHHLLSGRNPQHAPPFQFPPVRQFAPGVPTQMEAALARALAIMVTDRFPTMEAFLAALGGIGAYARTSVPATGAGSGVAGTTNILVAPDGSGDVRTLEEARQHAPPGAVIRLAAGEHLLYAPVTLSQAVTLEGAGRERTRVVCTKGGDVLRCAGPGPVVLRDLTVAHEGYESADVVDVAGGGFDCTNCRCTGAVFDQAAGRAGTGLWLHGTSTGRVRGCEMLANKGNGIAVIEQARATLEANTCRENTGSGIAYKQPIRITPGIW